MLIKDEAEAERGHLVVGLSWQPCPGSFGRKVEAES